MEKISSYEIRRSKRMEVQALLNELLAENNETIENLRIKLALNKKAEKYLKQGRIYNLITLHKIAMLYGKKVKINFE